jgi:beta-glucosidase-like glycosyl hydrolase
VDPALDYKGDTTFMLIRRRAFGHDPGTITAKAGAFIAGIKKEKGLSILKHFPGYGVHNNSDEHIPCPTSPPRKWNSTFCPSGHCAKRPTAS